MTLLLGRYIGEYVSVYQASRARGELRAQLHRAQQENSNLRAQVQILQRPERIDDVARRMGMEQRVQAHYVALAPPPAAPAEEKNTPVLAGLLPEPLMRLFKGRR